MDVEIEQRGRALTALAEQPGERGRDRRGTDAAARADHRGRAMRPFDRRFDRLGGVEHRLRVRERLPQHVWVERFEQVILDAAGDEIAIRSEEHTSELQSLMRISYAVFCL